MYDRASIIQAVRRLRVWSSGERRAPHKPLLLLLATGQLMQGRRELPFEEVEDRLGRLLQQYAPPVRGRHQPALPYWHLRSDGLWVVPGDEDLELQRGGFPRMSGLRRTSGSLAPDVAAALLADPDLVEQVVQELLYGHFPESLHEGLRSATGLDRVTTPPSSLAADGAGFRYRQHGRHERRARDPVFRESVLRAYEHRCAATGFRAALRGSFFGVEAAHMRWHCHGGPDIVANGLVLDPTMHLLLDRGAWSLTDDRRILVSAEFTGSEEALGRLRELHGRPLRAPLPGHEPLRQEFIRWHREPELGGVFRAPALGQV